ncbi:MAG: aldo/keto reductase [Solirubrobacterales bacterium]|nr:aldo/keto reductase [Solirubrobacterales bacterium]
MRERDAESAGTSVLLRRARESPRATSAPPTSVRVDRDVVISRVGFSCANIMRLPSSRERHNLVAAAIDAGLTHFDVARLYGLGETEGELGRVLRAHSAEVTVATKFGIDAAGTMQRLGRLQAPARFLLARSSRIRAAVRRRRARFTTPRVYDAEKARLSLDTSLRELALAHVDILFLHDPRPADEIDGDALVTFLEGARAAGKIRAWGMSFDDQSGLQIRSRLPDPGILQLRHDALTDTEPRPRSIAFGSMSAHADIARWLSCEPQGRHRWTHAIGADPLKGNLLAALLLSNTLEQDGVMACLYATTKVARLALPASVLGSPVPAAQLHAFLRCLADDRDSILTLAAR